MRIENVMRIQFVAIATLALAGCYPTAKNAVLKLDFAKTSKGFVNSGIDSTGSLFIVDLESKTARKLEDIDLSKYSQEIVPPGNSLVATDIKYAGVTIDGVKITDKIKLAELEARASSQAKIVLTNYSSSGVRSPWDVVEAVFQNTPSQKLRDGWLIDDVIGSRNRIYVLVSGQISADQTLISFGNAEGKPLTSTKVSIQGVEVEFRLEGASTLNMTGKNAPALIRLYAFRPSFRDGYKFKTMSIDNNRNDIARDIAESLRNQI